MIICLLTLIATMFGVLYYRERHERKLDRQLIEALEKRRSHDKADGAGNPH